MIIVIPVLIALLPVGQPRRLHLPTGTAATSASIRLTVSTT